MQPTIKIVPVEISKDFTPEDGYSLNDISILPDGSGAFAITTKIPERPMENKLVETPEPKNPPADPQNPIIPEQLPEE